MGSKTRRPYYVPGRARNIPTQSLALYRACLWLSWSTITSSLESFSCVSFSLPETGTRYSGRVLARAPPKKAKSNGHERAVRCLAVYSLVTGDHTTYHFPPAVLHSIMLKTLDRGIPTRKTWPLLDSRGFWQQWCCDSLTRWCNSRVRLA